MASDGRTTHLDCEEASEFITPRTQTRFPRVKAGIALTAIGGVLCLAATYATGTYPFQQDPWAQYHRVQGKMLEAFSKSRALAASDTTGFKTSVTLAMNEEGAADPDAMSMKVKLADAAFPSKWPKVIMTLEAKKGKQYQLKQRCETIMSAINHHMCKGHRHYQDCLSNSPPLSITAAKISTHFKYGSWTFLELPLPRDQTGKAEAKDLEAALKDNKACSDTIGSATGSNERSHGFVCGHFYEWNCGSTEWDDDDFTLTDMCCVCGGGQAKTNNNMKDNTFKPDVSAKLSFGRTIQEMFNNKQDNLVVLPSGIKAKLSATFASIAFQTMKESGMMDPGSVQMIEGLASVKARLDVHYKKGGESYDALGDFSKEISQAQKMLKHGPPEITKHLVGLEDLMEGIKGVVFSDKGEELLVTFENFHPGPVFTDILDQR